MALPERCEALFGETGQRGVTTLAEKVRGFQKFVRSVDQSVLERSYVVELHAVALLAKEHLLMFGTPGNAKSMTADLVLSGIVDDTEKPSYFRIQMTPETTMSETHGPMDYKKLELTGEYDRLHKQGMGEYHYVFIDEIFDARPNATRNLLGFLQERGHPQGSHRVEGKIETVVAATNRYFDEVYRKAGDDGPRGTQDRFAFNVLIPASFEYAESYSELIRTSKAAEPVRPRLRRSDLVALQSLVRDVKISKSVAMVLALLSSRMKAETEALEAASAKEHDEKIRAGESAPSRYFATKLHSARTLGKAAKILRAMVVYDWIVTGGQRKLIASVDDVRKLRSFFTMNGPSDDFVRSEIARTSNLPERAQLTGILQEREIFDRIYAEIIEEMDSASVKYALTEATELVVNAQSRAQKEIAVRNILATLARIKSEKQSRILHRDLSGSDIGRIYVQKYLESSLAELLPSGEVRRLQWEIAEKRRSELLEIHEEELRIKRAVEQGARREAELLAREKEIAERFQASAGNRYLPVVAQQSQATMPAVSTPPAQAELFKDWTKWDTFVTGTNWTPASRRVLTTYDPVRKIYAASLFSYDGPTSPDIAVFDLTKTSDFLTWHGAQTHDGIGNTFFLNGTEGPQLKLFGQLGSHVYDLDKKTVLPAVAREQLSKLSSIYDPTHDREIALDKKWPDSSLEILIGGERYPVSDLSAVGARSLNGRKSRADILAVGKNGNYVVVRAAEYVYAIDLNLRKVSFLATVDPEPPPGEADFQIVRADRQRNDMMILRRFGDEVTVLDVSGDKPVVQILKLPGFASSKSSVSHVAGTQMLLVSDAHGISLIDGATGSSILTSDQTVFGKLGEPIFIRSFADGYMVFSKDGNADKMQIWKVKP